MDKTVESYFSQGLAPSSQRVYATGIRQYTEFCQHFQLSQLPVMELHLCCFVTALANDNVSHSTIKVYLSGVRQLHLKEGYKPLETGPMARLQQVLKGIRKSKTDVFRQGAKIHLGRTDDDLCPVAALLSWMIQRGNHPGPLFTFASGRALTRPTLVMRLREALSEAGFNPQGFSGHSFRAGAATTVTLRGLEDSCIKQLGRWKSTAYLRYIKPVPQHVAALSNVLSSRTVRSHRHEQEQLRSHSIKGISQSVPCRDQIVYTRKKNIYI